MGNQFTFSFTPNLPAFPPPPKPTQNPVLFLCLSACDAEAQHVPPAISAHYSCGPIRRSFDTSGEIWLWRSFLGTQSAQGLGAKTSVLSVDLLG